jgi:iron complex outermembrane receptor protein
MERTRRARLCLLAGALMLAAAPCTQAAESFADLSLEQLSNIVVTSVGKRSQRLREVAGSVFVIRAEDIRRAGATSLPEALRLAPNLQVARAGASQYAITARSGADVLANKMLVMIDGRTIYSPLFSGVFWEAQDLVLDDIDRIEVLSGAGGTLYGSNAFHGVINIITRPTAETTGTLARLAWGSDDRYAAARWGRADASSGLRLYAKRRLVDASSRADGTRLPDAAHWSTAGFRGDLVAAGGQWMFSGQVFDHAMEDALGSRNYRGGHLLGRYSVEDETQRTQVQVYVERVDRERSRWVRNVMDTVEIDFQQERRSERHSLLWGGGWRSQHDDATLYAPAAVSLRPENRRLDLWNAFAQNEFAVTPALKLTLGLKAEHNRYTGLEWLPSARLAWSPAAEHLLWAGASRVVRTPARIDRDVASPPLAYSPRFVSEVANVFELGYRGTPAPRLSYAATLFHHRFSRLRSLDFGAGGATFNNNYEGRLSGLETWAEWRATDRWRLHAGYIHQKPEYSPLPGTAPAPATAVLGNDVRSQASLRSSWDLGPATELDISVRRVGARPAPAVPAYTAVDLRLGWRPHPALELSLIARNLNRGAHFEWGAEPGRAESRRSVLLLATWRH